MLTKANLKRSKGNSISLVLVMLLVALFVNIAFVMLFGIGDFFDRHSEELNVSHFVTQLSDDENFSAAQQNFIQQDPRIEASEIQEFVQAQGDVLFNGLPDTGLLMFSRVYANQIFNPLTLIDDYLPLTGHAIYIPHYMMLGGNMQLGDPITFSFMDEDFTFTVAGSVEEIMFGAQNGFRRRMYVSDEMYVYLRSRFPGEVETILLARLYDSGETLAFVNDYIDYLIDLPPVPDAVEIMSLTHNSVNNRGSHLLIPIVVGSILAVFAVVFLIVSLVVIRFRISNSIDEGMENIGIQKAVGYKNREIIGSVLMQFGLIAAVGGVVGVLVSQLLMPVVTSIFGQMFPFVWRPDINVVAKLIMLGFIVGCVLFFSFLSSVRIFQLYPIVALRGGRVTQRKRNVIPIEETPGALTPLLALKDILQNKRQAIAVGVIIFGITFTAVVGIGTHYAVNVNSEAFLTTLIGETFELAVIVRDESYTQGVASRLRQNPQVTGVTGVHNGVRLSVEGMLMFSDVFEDSAEMRGNMLVRGRYPIYDHEIALSTAAMQATGMAMGDTVTVRSGGQDFEFYVIGKTQSMDGAVTAISGDGMRRMQDFEFQALMVFLEDGTCGTTFANMMRETEGDIFVQIMVFDEIAEGFIESLGGIFAAITVVIMVVVGAIVIATIYLVIKTAILRKRRELGVQKALGFTTFQLMNQISLGLTPAILLGAAAGAIVGFNTFDLFFVLVSGVAGSVSVNIPLPLMWTIFTAVGVVVLSYVVSMAVAWRIRKISAYRLVTE